LRRADRLFRLVQLLRGRRLSTAAWLAGKLEVSPRTVYRDVADLQAQGVPIEGEAGVGYRLRPGFDLPPLMFTAAEAQALVAAVRLAEPRLDRALAAAAEEALAKILAELPAAARVAAETLPLYAGPIVTDAATGERLQALRDAVAQRRKVGFDYVDAQGTPSARIVRPLGCFHWDAVWTLVAWCEERAAFRSFRLDRMRSLRTLDDVFRDEEGRTLPAFLRQARAERARRRAEAGRPAGADARRED
jgi:predicted DNA-binding transcriptional regulator YafY